MLDQARSAQGKSDPRLSATFGKFCPALIKEAVKKKIHQQPQEKKFLFLWLLVQFFFHRPLADRA